jgi:uncharacterized protein YcaQ
MPAKPVELTIGQARRTWLHAQRLDTREPFGAGPEATRLAVEHLGYVQIDTINVIERSHHHILFSRIPRYRRRDLQQAQSADKSVFEYWTHALAYIPTRDFRFFWPQMRRHRTHPELWGQTVDPKDYRRVIRLIRENGPITIRDIDDEVLVEKEHLWASRKPSKGALQLAFWNGVLTVSARSGMLKTYELMERHFGWNRPPRGATERQGHEYLLDTALRAQGVVSLDSVAHVRRNVRKPLMALIEGRVRRKRLVPVMVASVAHWAEPQVLDTVPESHEPLVHVLSPFDPVVIQRKRLKLLFGYEHLFEAYVPKDRRVFGYFTLPVLVGDEVVAALDLKTDRAQGQLRIQAWHWIGKGRARAHKRMIEEELGRFEAFQLGD